MPNAVARLLLLSSLLMTTACSHVVTIESVPPGANVKVDGQDMGQTPVTLDEKSGFFESHNVEIELEGYRPIQTQMEQSEIIWGVAGPALCAAPFTAGISLIGCCWSTEYGERYTYEMSPAVEVGDGSFQGGRHGAEEPKVDDPAASVPY